MLRFAFLYISLLAVTAVLVLSLNALDAGTAVSLTVFALFGVAIGFGIAYFLDRIPHIFHPRRTRHHSASPRS
jgi:hypothetical protein